jgi:hypothetical protein
VLVLYPSNGTCPSPASTYASDYSTNTGCTLNASSDHIVHSSQAFPPALRRDHLHLYRHRSFLEVSWHRSLLHEEQGPKRRKHNHGSLRENLVRLGVI